MRRDVTAPRELKDRLDARKVQALSSLASMTPSEASAWVNANVTDLASAKKVLQGLAAAVAYLARHRI